MLLRLLLASTAVGVATAYIHVRRYYHFLASQIRTTKIDDPSRKLAKESGQLDSLPNDLLDRPEDLRIVHERDEIELRKNDITSNARIEELFTRLLRRNMLCFSQLPQSYMLRLILKTPEQRRSFSRSHIASLDFKGGDLVCGAYRVLVRSPLKVELGMEATEQMAHVSGRLIISLKCRENDALLSTETLQWTHAGGPVLPLERAPSKFMHEMASWWLLVSGARYIEDLRSTSES